MNETNLKHACKGFKADSSDSGCDKSVSEYGCVLRGAE